MYTLKADRFICRLSHGGGGREKCPTPCKKGGGIVRAGEMRGGGMSGKICPAGNVWIIATDHDVIASHNDRTDHRLIAQ